MPQGSGLNDGTQTGCCPGGRVGVPRPRTWDASATARSALQASAIVWFVPALIGQWFFGYHIAATFIGTALAGNFAAWNKTLFVGLVAGDLVGNMALGAHLFVAFVITIGGTLQLIPQARVREQRRVGASSLVRHRNAAVTAGGHRATVGQL
jgi:hypothetical protein